MNDPAAPSSDRRLVPSLDEEVIELRRKLQFYEGFDQIIRDNIAQAGTLLRQTAERRAATERILDDGLARLAQEREANRAALEAIAPHLDTLKNSVRALDEAVAAAVGAFAAGSTVAPGDAEPSPASDVGEAEVPASPASVDPSSSDNVLELSASDQPPTNILAEMVVEDRPLAVDGPPSAPGSNATPTHHATTLVVHGLDDAGAVGRLVRRLQYDDTWAAVDVKEFMGGVLRLVVKGERPMSIADIGDWMRDASFELVDANADSVIVKHREASSF